MRVSVVLADDHNLVRAGIRALLERLEGVTVVAEAADGRTALELIAQHEPDLALLDVSMPGLNGLEAAQRIAGLSPRTRVAILSMHATEAHVRQALQAGVTGYLLKDACIEELPVLMSALRRGETYLSPAISQRLIEVLRGAGTAAPAPQAAATLLTPRQREILQLVAEGKSTKEIASLLDLSVKTVETHRAQIMQRLDIHDVAGLVRYAVREGLVGS